MSVHPARRLLRPVAARLAVLAVLLSMAASPTVTMVSFVDPADDANRLNAQGEKAFGSVDQPTPVGSQPSADIRAVRMTSLQDADRPGFRLTFELTGAPDPRQWTYYLDGDTSCGRFLLSWADATPVNPDGGAVLTICGASAPVENTVEGTKVKIVVPSEVLVDLLPEPTELGRIWFTVQGNFPNNVGVLDTSDAGTQAFPL